MRVTNQKTRNNHMRTVKIFLTAIIAVLLTMTSCKKPVTYTVTFDSQSADVEANPTSKTVTSPAITIDELPAPPEKTNYSFGGWFTEVDGGGTGFTASTEVTGDITVYAKWTEISYTVAFDSQDADTDADPTSKTVTRPAMTIDELPAPPEKTNYSFDGWFTEVDGGGTEFTASTEVADDITVYAKWTEISYTVTFDSQGADTEADPTSKTVTRPATTIDELPTPPEKTNYSFGGWFTEVDGGGTGFTASTEVTGDITVYAKWTEISYTVAFDSQDADTDADPTSKTVTRPAMTIDELPTAPEKTYYSFSGWFTEVDGGGTEFTASTEVTEDITVYAKWELEYNLGDPGPAGGFIFYINPNSATDGWKYLEAAPASTEWFGPVWGGWGTEVNGANETAIGTGKQNTIDIVAQYGDNEPYDGSSDYAAKLCSDLVSGGYDDWFLPSKDELYQIYINLITSFIGGFVSTGDYWSSSEIDGNNAWSMHVTATYHESSKAYTKYVRAVRAF